MARKRLDQLRGEVRMVLLGTRLRDRLRICSILSFAHLRLGRGRVLLGWIPVGADLGRPVELRTGVRVLARRRDAVPLYEQFALDVYGVRLPFRVARVLDLGANVGFASVALAARYPDASFVCVEPEEESRALLEANLSRNAIRASVVAAAAAGAPGRFDVTHGRAPGSDSVVASVSGVVPGLTVSELLDRADWDVVDLMKIDIEGGEWGVFADAGTWARRVRAVIGELHPVSAESAERASEMLGPHGFARVALPDSLRFRDVCLWVRR